jgi:hypothetical protein
MPLYTLIIKKKNGTNLNEKLTFLCFFHAAGRYRRFCMIQNPPGTLNSRPSTYKSDLG